MIFPCIFYSFLLLKVVLHSVHLNAFSPVSFILCVLSNQNYKSKQFFRVCSRMLSLLYVSFFNFFQIRITTKSSFADCVLECFFPASFILHFLVNQYSKSKQCCMVCPWTIFPLYVSFIIFFQIKIMTNSSVADIALECFFPFILCLGSFQSKLQKQAVLHGLHLNNLSPVCFILHFLSN